MSTSIQGSLQIGRFERLVRQFSKFFIVGIINTGIDFAVFNIEILVTGIESGPGLMFLNSISFSIAVVNSYFMNKWWTFEDKRPDDEKTAVKFSQFLTVSLVGLGINNLALYGFTEFVPVMFGLSAHLWTNIAKVFATGISMIWNFVGYKLWVFKK